MTRSPKLDRFGTCFLRVDEHTADGFSAWNKLTVRCPRRGRIGLEVCVGCEHFGRLIVQESSDALSIQCRCEAAEAPTKIRLREAAPAARARLEHTAIGDLLRPEQLCLSARLGLKEVRTLFEARGIDRALVVDDQARPVGVLSQQDLGLASDRDAGGVLFRVREVMGPVELSLPEDASVGHAVALASARNASAVVVVHGSGGAAGLLRMDELCSFLARGAAN